MTYKEALEKIRDLSSIFGDSQDSRLYIDLLDEINTIALHVLGSEA